MDGAECVRRYKSLAQVERAFRTLKTVDLKVRPYRTPNLGDDAPTFQVTTTANPKQQRALELVREIAP